MISNNNLKSQCLILLDN